MKPVRLLLLEDNPHDAELIQANLRAAGLTCQIDRAATRREFEQALTGNYHLILADCALPDIDGSEAMNLARAACPEVPFLVVSGAIGEERAVHLLRNGATDCVLKDHLDRLAPSVQRALREAEERAERRRAEHALQESEERFRLLVHTVQDYAIFMLDPAGRVVSWNEGSERIVGYKAGEVLGQSFARFFPSADVDAGRPGRILTVAVAEGRAKDDGWLVRKDGQRVWASGVATALRSDPAILDGFAIILRDLTDRKLLQDALQEQTDLVAEASQRKDEYFKMLSHELRNPLSPILNALAILNMVDSTDAAAADAREVLTRQVNHLIRLVDDLLDVYLITQGTARVSREPIELGSFVRETIDPVQRALQAAGIRFTLELPPRPIRVRGDRMRLAQVIGHLLQYVGKSGTSGDEVTVCVEADPGGTRARVIVSSTGGGFEPELLAHVFDLVTRGDASLERRRSGLGLGLALVRGLVELHEGRVEAASPGPGQGVLFTVSLPAEPMPPVETVPISGPRSPRFRRLRVLIVEDNRDTARTLRTLLTKYGHETAVAYSGTAGVALARQWRPDVVLCDLGLPELDGYGVARELRSHPGTASARLIAVTGYGQEADRLRSFEVGFDQHITKPLEPSELQKLLQSAG